MKLPRLGGKNLSEEVTFELRKMQTSSQPRGELGEGRSLQKAQLLQRP